MTNTIVVHNEIEYQLIYDADTTNYRNDAVYAAPAIMVDAKPDADGLIPVYTLRWYIPAEAGEDESPVEESIDWSTPDEVDDCKGNQSYYEVATGNII